MNFDEFIVLILVFICIYSLWKICKYINEV